MSVQAGIWNIDGKPVDEDLLVKINRASAGFVADGDEIKCNGEIGWLYRALHMTAESRRERQPHCFGHGNVIMWDGRLDNREALISALGNNLTPASSDVVIVAAAFEWWGTDCFPKLIGDWAVSIWNPGQRTLTLARDFAGVRHLFYRWQKDAIVWCSHLAPLALSSRGLRLNEQYLAGLLTMWPDANLTPFQEIQCVPPGKFVTIGHEVIRTQAFWVFDPLNKCRYKKDEEYEEHFRHVFRQAVRRRLRTDSPVLAELSGGLDSSSIVCMADDVLAHEGAEAPRVATFSCYDLDEPDEEDVRYFTAVESKRGEIGHHAEVRSTGDTLVMQYRSFAANPGFGVRTEVNEIRSEIIKRFGHRVLLSGLGGDEVLGQTLDPRILLADLIRQFRIGQLAKEAIEWSLRSRRPLVRLLIDALLLNFPKSVRSRVDKGIRVEKWLNKEFARRQRLSSRRLRAAGGSWLWPASDRDAFQTISALACQMNMAAPNSYETRYPYLDQTLLEFLFSIPAEQLLRPGESRSLMRRSLKGLLPAAILSRRTKSGMGRCIIITLEKHWRHLEPILRSCLLAQLGYVDQASFFAALTELKNGTLSPQVFRLLQALSCELWLRDATDRGVIAIPPSSHMVTADGMAESAA
ncbi:MAG TPA: asparagine synthase-related protein [Terriglobales bacterium]|jgi:asparagine synthase (glutamine-hydrolysing)|nr:asparagine synthase-related protein [Terriglobales bacterium]